MIKSPRAFIVIFALLFALQHAVLGFFWLEKYRDTQVTILAFALYIFLVVPSILLYRGIKMAHSQAIANAVGATLIPALCLAQLEVTDLTRAGSFATWFVGAVSTLMAVTALRGYAKLSWIGVAMLWIQVIAWGGPAVITTSGLIGSVLFVAAASAIARGLRITNEQAETYLSQASNTSAQTAQVTAARVERKNRVESALHAAMPMLQRIIDAQGKLSAADRVEALLTEAALRDEIHGKNLIDDGVRIAAREARRRGVEVSIIDDGGADQASAFEALAIRTSIAQAISSTQGGTIAVRSPKGESFMVSITAQRPGVAKPDLWLRLP